MCCFNFCPKRVFHVNKQKNWNQPSKMGENFKIQHQQESQVSVMSVGRTQALEDHIEHKKT